MKSRLLLAGLYLLAATALRASPTRAVSVVERFAGSNDGSYLILRTEIDNLGSHYSSQRKVYLDERSKDGKTTVKSTLLLDENRSIDADHKDPDTPPPVAITVNSRDDSISLASVQEKFPQSPTVWDTGKLGGLTVNPEAGVLSPGLTLAEGKKIVDETFGGRNPEQGWKLLEVSEDKNAIYLKLAKGDPEEAGDDEGPETRVVCIGLERTWQFHAQANRKKLYLLAGIYDKQEDAIAQAGKWHRSSLEVWTFDPLLKYAVVDAQAEERIKTLGGMKKLAESLGVELEPISGSLLGQRIQIP